MMMRRRMESRFSTEGEAKLDAMLATWASGVRLSRSEEESIRRAVIAPDEVLSASWWKDCLRAGSSAFKVSHRRFALPGGL